MSIPVVCPECGKDYKLKNDLAGKRVKCQSCQASIEVPANAPAKKQAASAAAKPAKSAAGKPAGKTSAQPAAKAPAASRPASKPAPRPAHESDDLFGALPDLAAPLAGPSQLAGPLAGSAAAAPAAAPAKKKGKVKAASVKGGKRKWLPWAIGGGAIAVIAIVAGVILLTSGGKKATTAGAGGNAPAANPAPADSGLPVWAPHPDFLALFTKQHSIEGYSFKFPPAYHVSGAKPLPQAAGRTVVHKSYSKAGRDADHNASFHIVVITSSGQSLGTSTDAAGQELVSLLTAALEHEGIVATKRDSPIHGKLAGRQVSLARAEGTVTLLPGVTAPTPTNVAALIHVEANRIMFAYAVCNDKMGEGDYAELESMLLAFGA